MSFLFKSMELMGSSIWQVKYLSKTYNRTTNIINRFFWKNRNVFIDHLNSRGESHKPEPKKYKENGKTCALVSC